MGGTRGSGFVSTADCGKMSVVCGVRGVDGVWEMCMSLARSGVRVGVSGLGLGFTNPVGIGGVWDVRLCLGCGGGGVEWVAWSREGWVVLCMCEL